MRSSSPSASGQAAPPTARLRRPCSASRAFFRLAAPLAGAEGAVLDLLESQDDVAEQATVAVAQLEEELSGVGRVGLIAQILDRVVLLVLAVEGAAPHFLEQLMLLLEQALFEGRHPFFSHQLLPSSWGAGLR